MHIDATMRQVRLSQYGRGYACYTETHSPMHSIQFVVCVCHNYAVRLSLIILYFF